MPRGELRLPVFLPGTDRSWTEVAGVCTIHTDGIHITLENQEDMDKLVEMAQERVLLQVSFDYKMSDDVLKRIHDRHKVNCLNPECPEAGNCGGKCAREFGDRKRRL